MAISVVSFSFSWCSTGGPGAQLSPECWLSPPHLVTNRSPKLLRVLRATSAAWGFTYHISSLTHFLQLSDFLSWPSYIIVQCSLNRPLNLWNGVFNRHQAEITVMQFRGHCLPLHQSMSVSWAFTLSHFISQIRIRDFFRLLAIGMCHFLPVHHFRMACLAGSKVKIQHVDLKINCGIMKVTVTAFVVKVFGIMSELLEKWLEESKSEEYSRPSQQKHW